jgi:hypothetical protein
MRLNAWPKASVTMILMITSSSMWQTPIFEAGSPMLVPNVRDGGGLHLTSLKAVCCDKCTIPADMVDELWWVWWMSGQANEFKYQSCSWDNLDEWLANSSCNYGWFWKLSPLSARRWIHRLERWHFCSSQIMALVYHKCYFGQLKSDAQTV